MKLLSWNIASGGFKNYSYDLQTPERLSNIIDVVKNSHADFVSLIDTFRWDTYFTTKELSKLFGYTHVFCINLNDERLIQLGHNNGITVLTNLDNPLFSTIQIAGRNVVKTHFGNDMDIDIFSVYLDDLSENTRLEQISALEMEVTNPHRTIITGDLNTIANEDVKKTKVLLKGFFDNFPQLQEKLLPQIEDMMRGEVVEKIKGIGMKNASDKFNPTIPTPLMFGKQEAFLRLDYVFLGEGIEASDFKVIKNNLTDIASDHYPTECNIRI